MYIKINELCLTDRHTDRNERKTKQNSLINDLCLTDRHTDRNERKTKENSLINDLCLTDPWGVLIYESGIYMCRQEFGEFRERPLTENGGGGF